MVRLTKDDIEKIYDELDRRINEDIKDGNLPAREKYISEERASRAQGVYGTIMAIVPNDNWRDIVWWMDEIEEKRYGKRVWE